MAIVGWETSGTHYPHRMLWHGASMLHKAAPNIERGGLYADMAASLFLYLALEGFLNHLGEQIAPDEWAKERQFFSQEPYAGTLGKLDFVAERVDLAVKKDYRPYQTIKRLHALRQGIVHPRTEELKDVFPSDSKLHELGHPRFVKRVMEDLEILGNALVDNAQSKFGPSIYGPGNKAFRGLVQYQDLTPIRNEDGA